MSDEQLAALIAAVQSSKSEEKVKTAGGDDSESPDATPMKTTEGTTMTARMKKASR